MIKPDDDYRSTHADLWAGFSAATTRDEYFQNWLELQCSIIPRTQQAILAWLNPSTASFDPVTKWPEDVSSIERLAEIIDQVIDTHSGMVMTLGGSQAAGSDAVQPYSIGYPVLIDGELWGIAALEILADTPETLSSAMEQLQWGISWLELFSRRTQSAKDAESLAQLTYSVELLAEVLHAPDFHGAAMSLVTQLATRLDCDRVSIGLVSRGFAQVRAISHSAKFEKRTKLVRSIGRAMDEAIIQRKAIRYPLDENEGIVVTQAHAELSSLGQREAILTVPLYHRDQCRGAITLERSESRPFGANDADICAAIASMVAPILEEKRQSDQVIAMKVLSSLTHQISQLVGPHHIWRKMIALLLAGAILFFTLATGEYRVSANTYIEGATRRVIVAPFDGYVQDAPLRAGDEVAEGTILCRIDDRDMRLEKLRLSSQEAQLNRRYQESLSAFRSSDVSIIKAQLDQIKAQIELIDYQLDKTRIRSPLDGILISGDLTHQIGSPVDQGQVLFEIAPLTDYRVILEVDERRIADMSEGQKGILVLSALPDRRYDIIVKKITPIATSTEGVNVFRVEAALETAPDHLRPGMEGISKITVDRRKIYMIWGQGLIDWIRLWVWSWWP